MKFLVDILCVLVSNSKYNGVAAILVFIYEIPTETMYVCEFRNVVKEVLTCDTAINILPQFGIRNSL